MTEEEREKRWGIFHLAYTSEEKISEHGFENVINDERMLQNFSKGLRISTGELKEKIRINAGVV